MDTFCSFHSCFLIKIMDLETNHGVSRLPAILPSALKEKLLPLLMTTLGDIIHVCFVVLLTSCSILVPSFFLHHGTLFSS